MSKNLYVTSVEAGSGKSLVMLGLAEMLSPRVEHLGFFRSVKRAGVEPDNDTELIRQRYCTSLTRESMYGVTHEEARDLYVSDQLMELLKRIVAKYKALEDECDIVLCEGTDLTGLSSPFEFEFNARVANHLGCPALIVLTGREKQPSEQMDALITAREGFENESCAIAAIVVNRVEPDDVERLRRQIQAEWRYDEPVYVLPEHPTLARPTIGEIRDGLNAKMLRGSEASLHREALNT